jgi:hypothetical protein
MADVDSLLTQAGERWRASLPQPGALRPLPEDRPRGLPMALIVAAVIAMLIAVVAGLAAGGRPGASRSHVGVGWDHASLVAAVVQRSDRVRATGVVIATPGEVIKVCLGGADRLMGDPPRCLPIGVEVRGIDTATLPGRSEVKGVVASGLVTVRGTWSGDAIEVDAIAPAAYDPWLADLPCPQPEAGWTFPAERGAFRDALTPLVAEINGHPDEFGSYWTIPPFNPTNDSGTAVEVIETDVAPRDLQSRVEALFPYGACLVRGHFTDEQLAAVARALQKPDLTWIAGGGSLARRVAVQLTMLDAAAVAVFDQHPEAFPEPLVVKDSAASATATAEPAPTPTADVSPSPMLGLTSLLPPAGISEIEAIGKATQVDANLTGSGIVLSAVAGHYADVGPRGGDVAGDRWVWAVTFAGTFVPADCPSGAFCPAYPSTELVVLDFGDGSTLIQVSPAAGAGTYPPGDAIDAVTVVSKLETARAAGRWAEIWAVLAPLSRTRIGSFEQFVALEAAYDAAGGGFEIGDVVAGPFDATTIGYDVLSDLEQSGGDVDHAFLVSVRHPSEVGASAGSTIYLVARLAGSWEIWIVH